MTDIEIAYEVGVRHFERLGLLCADQEPTLSQEFLAQQEADDWETLYRSNPAACLID